MITKNLEYSPTHPVVLGAFVEELSRKGPNTWYFQLITDGRTGNSSIGTTMSKQYESYDAAVYGLNESIRQLLLTDSGG